MRSAPRSRVIFADSRWHVGLILAALLTQLLVIAPPVHAAMRGLDAMLGHAPTVAATAHVHTGRVAANRASVVTPGTAHHRELHGHCVIEWTSVSRAVTPLTRDAVSIVATVSALDCQHAIAPIARGIGPPVHADAQAILQVFRL